MRILRQKLILPVEMRKLQLVNMVRTHGGGGSMLTVTTDCFRAPAAASLPARRLHGQRERALQQALSPRLRLRPHREEVLLHALLDGADTQG